MKPQTFVLLFLLACTGILFAQSSQQVGPVQTSAFTRQALTNETAAGWLLKLNGLTNGLVQNITVSNSTVTGSTVTNSTVKNSTLTNNTILGGTIDGSAISNSVLTGGNATIFVDNVAALQALNPATVTNVVRTKGYFTPGDGGDGSYFSTNSATGANGGNIIVSPVNASYSWHLMNFTRSNFRQFGAKGDGTTDDTLSISNAFRANQVVYAPGGNYVVTQSINGTAKSGGYHFSGEGVFSKIFWKGAATGPVLDFSGSLLCNIKDIWIQADSGFPVPVGILFSRITGGGSAGQHHLQRVTVIGNFTTAAIFECTSEVNTYIDVEATTSATNSGAFAYIRSNTNHFGVASPYQTVMPSNGNTVGTWVGGSIRSFYSEHLVLLEGCSEFTMIGTSLSGGGVGSTAIEIAGNNAGTSTISADHIKFDQIRLEAPGYTNGIGMTTSNSFNRIMVDGCYLGVNGSNGVYSADGSLVQQLDYRRSFAGALQQVNLYSVVASRFDSAELGITIRNKAYGCWFLNMDSSPTLPVDVAGNLVQVKETAQYDGKIMRYGGKFIAQIPDTNLFGTITVTNGAVWIGLSSSFGGVLDVNGVIVSRSDVQVDNTHSVIFQRPASTTISTGGLKWWDGGFLGSSLTHPSAFKAIMDVNGIQQIWDGNNSSATNQFTNYFTKPIIATVGVGSQATSTSMTVAATGATNSTSINQIAWLTAATSLTLKDNAGNTIFSGQTVAALTPIHVQPGGSFTGTSITSAGSHAF